jgi:hypothetical protein
MSEKEKEKTPDKKKGSSHIWLIIGVSAAVVITTYERSLF